MPVAAAAGQAQGHLEGSPEGRGPDPDDLDPTVAQPAISWGDPPDATAAQSPVEVDVDMDATAAQAPIDVRSAALPAPSAMTVTVEAVRPERAGVGARVLDLLRGPDVSDTQPLDQTGVTSAVDLPNVATIPRRSVLAVSVVGVGLGAVVGITAAAGLLPFGDDEGVPGPAFDPGVYPRDPVQLDVADVRATSYLGPTGTNSYEPELVLDEDLGTAWNSDGQGRPDGVGERFTVRLSAPGWITALELANGYQKDDVRFLANARLARARLVFDHGEEVNLVLLDQGGWQRIPLPGPILANSFTMEVLESFPGDTYRDLGLSGLHVLGHAALGADREAATRDGG